MSNTEQQIEQEIQDKGLNAPRLTPNHIDSIIVDQYYFTAAQGVGNNCNGYDAMGFHESLKTLTFCVLILKNGFKVTGQSDCASPENFDAEVGKKVAYEDARNKVWMLEGYLLKEKLSQK
ncbi:MULTISPECIES: Gp49 family protein [unclassified Acinetobacter]|uniref:Gp49 family protein n=1 Tax=unclassified Acinetobacter TaxID=196816 RepID=UPI0015D33B00|nr:MULTISPECIES: Gp49 family protein [unclassified Acinetobacter]